jgi:hypothetical protein
MGRNGYSRRDTAQPATHGSTRRPRGDGRLDPVRWRRPGRGTLLRLAAVAALLATAAAVLWSPPKQPCDTGAPAGSGTARGPLTTGTSDIGGGNTTSANGGDAAFANGGGTASANGTGSATTNGAGAVGSDGSGATAAGGGAGSGSGTGPAVPEGNVGVPIRLADPTALSLVHPGNRVDLFRVDDAGGRPTSVAGSALVLQVTGADDPTTGGLLLALTPEQASRAVANSRQGFAVVIRPG